MMIDFTVEDWTLKNDSELCCFLESFQKTFCAKCDEIESVCQNLNAKSEMAVNIIRNLEVKLTSMSNRKFVDMKILEDNQMSLNRRINYDDDDYSTMDTMENVVRALKKAAKAGIETMKNKQTIFDDLPPFIGSEKFISTDFAFETAENDGKMESSTNENDDNGHFDEPKEKIPSIAFENVVKETASDDKIEDEVGNENGQLAKDPKEKSQKIFEEFDSFLSQEDQINLSSSSSSNLKNVKLSNPINLYDDDVEEKPKDPLSSNSKDPFTDQLEKLFKSKLKNDSLNIKNDEISQNDGEIGTKIGEERQENVSQAGKATHQDDPLAPLSIGKSHKSNSVNEIEKSEVTSKNRLFESDSDEDDAFHEFSRVLQKMKTANIGGLSKTSTPIADSLINPTPIGDLEKQSTPVADGLNQLKFVVKIPNTSAGVAIGDKPVMTVNEQIISHIPSDSFITVAKSRTKGPPRKPPARTIKVEKQNDDLPVENAGDAFLSIKHIEVAQSGKQNDAVQIKNQVDIAQVQKAEVDVDEKPASKPIMKINELKAEEYECPNSSGRSNQVKSIFDSESDDEMFNSSASKEADARMLVKEPEQQQQQHQQQPKPSLLFAAKEEIVKKKQSKQAVKSIFDSDSDEDLDLFRKKK